MTSPSPADAWPALPLDAWADTYATLHRWTQIVGKVRLAQTPPVNHSWHVTLYVSARGLGTGPIPHGTRIFDVELDFIDHRVTVRSSDGGTRAVPLRPQTTTAFYSGLMQALDALDLHVHIVPKANEVPDTIPLDHDDVHRAYDAEYATRFWRVLVQADRVFRLFRSRFVGKCSPVHFFWGAPDLAVTRFSGRPAPPHPGGVANLPDAVAREAYSHEVSSCGFWPGGGPITSAAFYAYAYPEPPGFAQAAVEPREAFYSQDLREFILPYDAVRTASSPDDTLLAFLQSTYAAAADLGHWDRAALERAATG